MRRLYWLLASLLLFTGACVDPVGATPPLNAAPPANFSLFADTVRITSSPCSVTSPATSCRILVSRDSLFATTLSDQTIANGAMIRPVALSCNSLEQVTIFARAWGVDAGGNRSPSFTTTSATARCSNGVGLPINFRIMLQVDSTRSG